MTPNNIYTELNKTRPIRKIVKIIPEKNGPVSFTETQLHVLISVARGDASINMDAYRSTIDAVVKRICCRTGWKRGKTTQIFCRFAYKHKLVAL